MRFTSLVIKNVVRRPVRSGLTVAGLAVGVGAVVALVGVAQQSEDAFLAIYQHQRVSLVVLRAGAAQRLTSSLDESLAQRIAALPGVKTVSKGMVDLMSMPEVGPVGAVVEGWPPDSVSFDMLTVLDGRKLTAADTYHVMLGKTLATNLGKSTGDTVDLYGAFQFEVVGVFESTSFIHNGIMVMPLATLQEIMGREGQVTGFTVVVDSPGDEELVQRVAQSIRGISPRLDVQGTEEYVRTTREIRFVRAMAWVTSAVALLAGTIGILNTMIMSVFERTREIGILRAIGWRRRRLVGMILLESIVLSLCGAMLGSGGAVLCLRLLARVPAVAGVINGQVGFVTIGLGFVLALVIGLVGAVYPACRGARIMPVEAIRHE